MPGITKTTFDSKADNLANAVSSMTLKTTSTPTTTSRPEAEESQPQPDPFPFLSLPPEVRNRVYEWSLCPTAVLSLTRTKSSRLATTPIVIPQILSTCQKIYKECGRNRSYLFENEVCLLLDAHDTSWPVISETRLPQHVLSRLEHMFLVFDVTGNFRASYEEDVDFTALTALISLKKLRIAVIYDEGSGYPDVFCVAMLKEVLLRLPKEIEIVCEIKEASEQEVFLEGCLQVRKGGRRIPEAVKAMERENLEVAVAAVDESIRGTKNGSVEDVFAEYRMEPSKIGRNLGRR